MTFYLTGLLYAVGGYDGASRMCLSTVEAYNPLCDLWMPVPEMSCRRSGAGKKYVSLVYMQENTLLLSVPLIIF